MYVLVTTFKVNLCEITCWIGKKTCCLYKSFILKALLCVCFSKMDERKSPGEVQMSLIRHHISQPAQVNNTFPQD